MQNIQTSSDVLHLKIQVVEALLLFAALYLLALKDLQELMHDFRCLQAGKCSVARSTGAAAGVDGRPCHYAGWPQNIMNTGPETLNTRKQTYRDLISLKNISLLCSTWRLTVPLSGQIFHLCPFQSSHT